MRPSKPEYLHQIGVTQFLSSMLSYLRFYFAHYSVGEEIAQLHVVLCMEMYVWSTQGNPIVLSCCWTHEVQSRLVLRPL